ncbi:hypothetical protein BU23DRAFT_600169 [Bimuria novae-zelandiae CBS 107.79]|uniref:Uncharacterized protein n=1 Tax=Bimuria novae-zelandiae CBS 107.79 TaxID=1447943 RepID=A0A6A5V5T0_9PLEO|nr:hypothetical protein BU23DRAFT_600169 [Bimuria novae-zelandiae CBS 107.79]
MNRYSKLQENCCFFGRPIEPLAFYLPSFSDVHQQKQSPLYNVFPKEIRDLVFEYALADNGVPSPTWDTGDVATNDAAVALLQTCKAVYLEAYRLPMLLNGFFYALNYNVPTRPALSRLGPWQYALIQRLDFSVQQVTIEGGDLEKQLTEWRSIPRHSGAYVAPLFYHLHSPRTDGVIPSHNFGLTTFGEDTPGWHREDGDKVTLYRAFVKNHDPFISPYCNFTARAMVARPLTHLTIRMSRTDWWTWTDSPETSDSEEQLALDPACGKETRPLLTDMLALAAQRRMGQHPQYEDGTWGAYVAMLPDLKTLELMLETFREKKRQLEVVCDCAKTWKFPLKESQYELVCDGKIEELKWANVPDEDDGWETESELGSAAMDIDDDHSSDEEIEDHSSHNNNWGGIEEVEGVNNGDGEMSVDVGAQGPSVTEPQATADAGPLNGTFSPFHDHPTTPDGYHSPTYSVISHDYELTSSPFSPPFSPASLQINPVSPVFNSGSDYNSLPLWYETATDFEVRVVRFKRQRME